MAERFELWEPVDGIETPCAGVQISHGGHDLCLLLEFSLVDGGGDRDLCLRFGWGHVVGFASWQEFAHPWNTEPVLDRIPRLGGRWSTHAFPTLEVLDSNAVAGFDEGQRATYPSVRHFRIVTLDHTVDVLATAQPHAEWVQRAA